VRGILTLAALALIALAAACDGATVARPTNSPGPADTRTAPLASTLAPGQSTSTPPAPSSPEPTDTPVPQPREDPRIAVQRLHEIWPEVWSQYAPAVESYEFKVNCGPGAFEDPCFLSDLDAVTVITPTGAEFSLDRDFNVNEYSGEVTRRYVLYGPPDGGLPPLGDYTFRYSRGGEIVLEQTVPYRPSRIEYPTDVTWQRIGDDLHVSWTAPAGMADRMWYKAIVWAEFGTPDTFVSLELPWDAKSGVLADVPFVDGGTYSLNIAAYYSEGYAYSEYIIFTWPTS